jgi:hypothetical protein
MGHVLLTFLFLLPSFRANGEITDAKFGGGKNHSISFGTSLNIFARDSDRTCPNPNGPNCGMDNCQSMFHKRLRFTFQETAITVV